MSGDDSKKTDVAKREEEILAFWQEHKIFEKTEQKEAPSGDFVFYDGPPFATGLPHFGHLLPMSLKDATPRYKTMQGHRVLRKWGWDCHGLPIENIIEKELGLKSKKDIEDIGVDTFNKAARESVMRYANDWRKIVPRTGRFVDMDDDYRTMDASYTESVWWVFGELYKKNLISEGFKAMHLCPRCGTTLSNFEVAQGYKDIKDFSVTVKLLLEGEENTYLLAWTTTPWTLPGNMAAAVNKDGTYVSVKGEAGDIFILGKERLADVFGDAAHAVQKEFKGSELVGKKYTPVFDYYINKNIEGREHAWHVYHGDFVTQDDGTGIVHIAPAFGGDDLTLSNEHEFPVVHHVGMDGRFVEEVLDFKGLSVKPKDNKKENIDHTDTDVEIIKWLAHNGKLFSKQKIEHSYPHCWRCDTPLLNYATSSWFMTAPKIKEELIAANQSVRWVPNDIKDGRFGKWLEGVRDWAISRSRYWGAPIPVWKNQRTGEHVVIDSIEKLKAHTKTSGNTYTVMRHGQAESNVKNIVSGDNSVPSNLTEEGKKQALAAAESLKEKGIDIVFVSPLDRTQQTAEIVKETLGLSDEQVIIEERIKETQTGEFNGGPVDDYRNFFDEYSERMTKTPPGGENLTDMKNRFGEFIYELESKYSGKNILIVTHEYGAWMLTALREGADAKKTIELRGMNEDFVQTGSTMELNFVPLPHNENYELDLHRPYIDEVILEKDGETLERVPDVFDCWFESGSMPYGQMHYMGEGLKDFDPKKGVGFPADFIAEGLDQTRGWFYSMLVLGVALFGESPYKNVIVNGLVLAEDGRKMSKSLQNYPDLMETVNKYGADSIRYYLLSSPAVHAEDSAFMEKGVQEVMRKNIGRLNNVLSFYELYKNDVVHEAGNTSTHVLDRWIVARLNETVASVTKGMEQYELDRATRPIADFIDDLSTWYVRRSRDRFKGSNEGDKKAALTTTKFVLVEFSKVIAPFMPFYAEYLYKELSDEKESVHLADWPKGGVVDAELLGEMEKVRELITLGLEARDAAGIKVRQPLASISIPKQTFADSEEMISIMKDELNVKDVTEGKEVAIDTNLTPELIAEGNFRDLLRHVQELRKKGGLQPSDQVTLEAGTNKEGQALIKAFESELSNVAGLKEISFREVDTDPIKIGESEFRLKLVT